MSPKAFTKITYRHTITSTYMNVICHRKRSPRELIGIRSHQHTWTWYVTESVHQESLPRGICSRTRREIWQSGWNSSLCICSTNRDTLCQIFNPLPPRWEKQRNNHSSKREETHRCFWSYNFFVVSCAFTFPLLNWKLAILITDVRLISNWGQY